MAQAQDLRTSVSMRPPQPKRGLDLALATAAGLLSLPVIGVLALLVRRTLGPPAFFRQERAGRHGTPFHLIKLRTMTNEVDANGELLPDHRRMTRLGAWLRATSLDELPELWNVIRGDMSMVGPRPLPVRYLDRYDVDQARRHEVRPGITGWAQVNGRNEAGWPERLAMDVWYVDHRSLRLDLSILVRTARVVLSRQGVHDSDHPTMPEFRPGEDPT